MCWEKEKMLLPVFPPFLAMALGVFCWVMKTGVCLSKG